MESKATARDIAGTDPETRPLTHSQWLRYGPFLAQLVIIRRCNLSCGYCSEFDRVSEPVDTDLLMARLRKLRDLHCWATCLTGGEPTLHPDLPDLLREMRRLGFRRRMIITNGVRLTPELVETLNSCGLTDMQVSVDGVAANEVTIKVLSHLREKLSMLARHKKFAVVMSGVIGSAPPEEVLEVIDFAQNAGFAPRVLLIHDDQGRLQLTPEEMAAYHEVQRRIGRKAAEAHNYRDRLTSDGEAPFRCRAGARYLYVDEFGKVQWCSQTRGVLDKDLLNYGYADLRSQFHTAKPCHKTCTVGCARTSSAYDEWRPQAGLP